MYLESVESFVQQAQDLYKADPLRCRYTMKYRHCDGKLVIKITDNKTVSSSDSTKNFIPLDFNLKRFSAVSHLALPNPRYLMNSLFSFFLYAVSTI
jgi:hypothetical protein